ncbi:hypothetical protein O9929_16550 [Vibrio lentus]|nr:hypothetical protein [Vibrio lentus]
MFNKNSHHEYYLNEVNGSYSHTKRRSVSSCFFRISATASLVINEDVNRLTSAFDKQQEKQAQQEQRQSSTRATSK